MEAAVTRPGPFRMFSPDPESVADLEATSARRARRPDEDGPWHLASPFPMWVFDRATGAIIAANAAAARLYGFSREQLLAMTLDDLGASGVLLMDARDGGPSWTGPCVQHRADGSAFMAELGVIGTTDTTAMVIMRTLKEPPVAPEPPSDTGLHAKTLLARARPRADSLGRAPSETLSFVDADPVALAREACTTLRERADAKGTDILVYCACRAVHVEPQTFCIVLHDLIENAIEATRRGHPVVVDIREIEGDVLWQIQDAGAGMGAGALANLGDSSSGGVALAHAIVERHGGLLRFESAPGVGTTVSILLPGASGQCR
jgi:hypothetical protein